MQPLAYCLSAFVLVYVIYDLFDNLPDFIEAHTPFLSIVEFYLLLMPSVLIFIIPVSLLLAVLYSLSQLTKNNELTAMRASGVSLYRLMIPFIIVGLLASIAVSLINETIGPWSAYWTDQFVRSQRHKGTMNVYLARNLALKNERENRIWLIGEFDTRSNTLSHIEMVQQREDGSDLYKIRARKGIWVDSSRWWFLDLATQHYDAKGHPKGPPDFERRKEMSDLTETPRDFINEIKDPEFLSSFEILTFIERHGQLSQSTIARVMVDFHHRLAMPWTCFVVTLLGIPFGATTGRKGAFLGVLLSLGMFFGLYVLINVGLAFGKKEMISPWIAGWSPNIIFAFIGSILVYRMR